MIYAVVDTETTGITPGVHEVIEVAVVLFDRSERIIEEYCSYCSPSGPIPADATAVNNITNRMVDGFPRFYIIRPKVVELLEKADVLVGHNIVNFDMPMMNLEPDPRKDIRDTLMMCRERYPRRKHNLRRMCMFHKLKWDDAKAHGARYDCIMTMKLFLEMEFNKTLQQELSLDDSGDDEPSIIAGGGLSFLQSLALTDTEEVVIAETSELKEKVVESFAVPVSAINRDMPRLEGDTLIIPFSAPDKYQWQKSGQSVLETLQELGASQEIMEKYCKTEMSFNERHK